MDKQPLEANWNYPTSIRFGPGRISELADACNELKISSPLIVTDPGLVNLPMLTDIVNDCVSQGLDVSVFSGIISNPSDDNINTGVTTYKHKNSDGIIAIGGGSALDAGKAISLMVAQTRVIWDFEDVNNNWQRVNTDGMPPVIAIPTTAGTGSEVGRVAVITDPVNKAKRLIFHPNLMPNLVFLDPKLTIALPKHLTAATGMDAFSHALEAYCSPYFHPMAEGIALEAIRLVNRYLQRAVQDGTDLEARAHMMVASTMGATAFQKGLGGMHALAHPLGAMYKAHHGLLNAILMPYVLQANKSEIQSRVTRLAKHIDLHNCSFDGFIEWVVTLRENIGIPHTLSQIGINDNEADEVSTRAYKDPSAATNPITFSEEEYRNIFVNAVNGTL